MAEDRFARAKFDYEARSSEELAFKTGDTIKLISFNKSDDWWEGELNGASGLFPAAYVEKIKSESYKESMAQREAPVSSKIKALQEKAQLSTTESKSDPKPTSPPKTAADPGPDDESEQIIADLEQENELLRKSAEQLIEKLKVQKAAETELHKQLAEALRREEALMEQLKALKEKVEEKEKSDNKDDELADLEEENELLRKSAEQMLAKMAELKTADSEKAKKIASLEAENAKLKQDLQKASEAAATTTAAPSASASASSAGTSRLAAAMSAFSKKPENATPAPAASPAPAATGTSKLAAAMSAFTKKPENATSPSAASPTTSGGNRFAALVKSAAAASGVSTPTATTTPTNTTSKWGSAVSGVRQGGSTGPLQLDESVKRAYAEIRSDPPPITWAIFSYVEGKNFVQLSESGSGGFGEMTRFFKPEDRCYAFVRVTTGDSMSNRAKFIFITWVGERVSPLKKARVSTDRMFMKETIRDFALEIFANSIGELSESAIMAAVRRAGGADYGSSTN